MKISARILALTLLVALLSGCTSFEREWRHARLEPPAAGQSLAGPWQGTWLSGANGHTGELRCIVTQKQTDEYEFWFKATYWKIFRARYLVTMPVEKTAEGWTFKGQENLGPLAGGIYSYTGSVNGTNLNATYSCKFDHGIFKLSRP
ncbi:MAG: hypothetical protein K0Q55_2419 [Verrucomicrobia bacterium]|jgi:hypothetical protein|nr:hypothetical protein [Verrucomicrobiota bacterium]